MHTPTSQYRGLDDSNRVLGVMIVYFSIGTLREFYE